MKVAIITDTHFGARNDNEHFSKYFYQFYEGVFFPYLQQHDIKTVIHLGDLMDRRKYVSYKTAKEFRERFILPLKQLQINFHCLVGNHDIYFKNTNDVNSLQELIGLQDNKFHLYADATEVNIGGLDILFMPWINPQNYTYSLGMIDETKAKICMGHLEIKGFQMYKGQTNSEQGYEKELFRKFDTVFSGHFHHKNDDGQIYYLGSPYEIYWNDYKDKKGFHIFDTETLQLDRIVNPFGIHEKIYYDDSTHKADIHSEDYNNYDFAKYKNKFVKVIVVNKKDLYQFDQFMDKLLKANAHEVKVIEDFSDVNADNVSDDIVKYAEDTTTLVNKYIDELDIDLNKDRLKSIMRGLYNEAQDLEL
jgi:DNA repair exonuclease SbcCD nuclease subunit